MCLEVPLTNSVFKKRHLLQFEPNPKIPFKFEVSPRPVPFQYEGNPKIPAYYKPNPIIPSLSNKTAIKCLKPDIEQFPKGFINQKWRRHGAVF
jgi:hypothetical protein